MVERKEIIRMTLDSDVPPKVRKENKEWAENEKYLRKVAKATKEYSNAADGAVLSISKIEKGVKAASASFDVKKKNLIFVKGAMTDYTQATREAIVAEKAQKIAIQEMNHQSKFSAAIIKQHTIALRENAQFDRAAQIRKGLAALKSYNSEKKKAIALERTHAIALRDNIRYNEKAATAVRQQVVTRNRIEKATIAATKSQKDFILSTKGLERVLSILIIRRIFHQIITQMREAITTTIAYNKAITEIRTISQTMPATFNQWAESIREVAGAWDIGLLDAANARYQILSNQVAKGEAATRRFSATAFAFAKITKTTATSAVDLLSSALNAYGLSAIHADNMSAQLFKTIELGRIRSEDISSSFGRIVVVAAQLGIELAEVGAMMAIITNKGVKASEAMTLLRGVTMKLIKPTTAMKDLYAEWGVKTGEQAIATFGLLGVMQKLEEATRGSASEIGVLFGRIRATMGVTALVSDLEKFNDVLIQIRDTSKESYAAALEEQFKTSGEKFSRAINQMKIDLAAGIGQDFIDTMADYDENIKSISDTVTDLIETFAKLGIMVGLVWSGKKIIMAVAYLNVLRQSYIALNVLTARTLTAASAQSAYNTVLLAGKAAMTLGLNIGIYLVITAFFELSKRVRESKADIASFEEALREFHNNEMTRTGQRRTAYEDSVEAFRNAAQEALQASAAISSQFSSAILDIDDLISDEITTDFEQWIKDHQKLIEQDVKFTIDKYTKMYDVLIKKAEDYGKVLKDLKKDRLKLREEFAELIEESTREGLSKKDVKSRIEDQLKEAIKVSHEYGLTIDERNKRAAKAIELAKELFKLEKDSVQEARKRSAQNEADFRKRMNQGRPRGAKLPTRQREISDRTPQGIIDKFQKVVNEMAALTETSYAQEIAKQTEFQNIALKLAEEVRLKYVEIAKIINEMMERLSKPVIKELGGKATLEKFLTSAIEEGVVLELGAPDLITAIEEFNTKFDIIKPLQDMRTVLQEADATVQENTRVLTELINQNKERLKTIHDEETKTQQAIDDGLKEILKRYEESIEVIKKIERERSTQDMRDTPFDYTKLGQLSNEYKEIIKLSKTIDLDNQAEFIKLLRETMEISQQTLINMRRETPGGILYTVEEQAKILESLTFFEKITTDLEKSASTLADLEIKTPKIQKNIDIFTAQLSDMAQTVTFFKNWMDPFLLDMRYLSEEELKYLTDIVLSLQTLLKNTTGDIQRRINDTNPRLQARGGSVWGTDTVPTRLTPGEFVMNQRATRKFYGMLTSMNNGSLPGADGNDYSTHVGELSVTVQGGGTSQQTVNDIMSGIRRKIHRGQLARF